MQMQPDERVSRDLTTEIANLIQNLSINDDSVSASFAEAGMVGLEQALKIRYCGALAVPDALAWARADKETILNLKELLRLSEM